MFNLKEYLGRVKTEVTDPILEYMQEAGIDDFTAEDVARCGLENVPDDVTEDWREW